MHIYSLVLLVIFLSGCSTLNTSNDPVLTDKPKLSETKIKRWGFMVGRWYGSQPIDGGGVRQQINERFKDGTYKLTLRYKNVANEIEKNIEIGQWGIVGPVYFSIFRGWVKDGRVTPSNTEDPYNYDAYEIIKLTNEEFKYKSYSTNKIYTLKKVEEEFEFPGL